MNPGAVEEGAEVAKTVIGALKGEPISLALIIMNVIFVGVMGFGAYALNIRTTARYEAQDQLIHKLLDQCHLGGRSSLLLTPPRPPLPLPEPEIEHHESH